MPFCLVAVRLLAALTFAWDDALYYGCLYFFLSSTPPFALGATSFSSAKTTTLYCSLFFFLSKTTVPKGHFRNSKDALFFSLPPATAMGSTLKKKRQRRRDAPPILLLLDNRRCWDFLFLQLPRPETTGQLTNFYHRTI